jgi:hypothetical protein
VDARAGPACQRPGGRFDRVRQLSSRHRPVQRRHALGVCGITPALTGRGERMRASGPVQRVVGQAGSPTHFTGTAPLATMTAAPAELRTNSINLATVGGGIAFVTRNESRVSM